MAWSAQGDPIHAEVVSTDAHAGVAGTLYPSGSNTARVQTATEFLTITDIIFIMGANGGTFDIVFYPLSTGVIADGAGLRIAKGTLSANSGFAHHFETPMIGPKGYGVALIAAAGQVDLTMTGSIQEA
jgi:hypothetical protein